MASSRESICKVESEASFPWSSDELETINESQEYYARMLEAVAIAKVKGPVELPRKPKRKLEDLFNEKQGKTNKRSKEKMTCSELHRYLQSQLVDVSMCANRDFLTFSDLTFEKIKEKLLDGYQNIKRQNAQSFPFYLQYGKLLNKAFYTFQDEKKNRKMKDRWEDWLEHNVGIGASFARKIRDVAFIMDPINFPQFLKLSLSFSEVYRLKTQIQEMLNKPELAKEWKKTVTAPEQQETQPGEKE